MPKIQSLLYAYQFSAASFVPTFLLHVPVEKLLQADTIWKRTSFFFFFFLGKEIFFVGGVREMVPKQDNS